MVEKQYFTIEVEAGHHVHVDVDVFLPEVSSSGLHAVHDEPCIVVHVLGAQPLPRAPFARVLRGTHLRLPVKRARREDLGDGVPYTELTEAPRDKPVHEHGANRFPEKRDVVHVQMPLETRAAVAAVDLADDALR